jgi:pyruvate,water dikinase
LLGRLLEKLRPNPPNEKDLQERYFAFKELSSANDVALRDLVGLEGSLSEAQSLPGCDLHSRATEFTVQAFKSIRNLEIVADRPYPGLRETLTSLTRRMEQVLSGGGGCDGRDLPAEKIVDLLAPLNLTNPGDRSFRPAGCRTVHDILRFCQEESINSMFARNDAEAVRKGRFLQLGISVPLRIFVADLGGGLEGAEKKRPEIATENVASAPFRALIEGMTTEGVRWAGHVPLGIRSMVSVFANTLYDPVKHERNLGARSYAVVSAHYLNFSSRLGYHFSTLDASCGRKTNRGHISFRFKGGAASPEKRFRRAEFIARILRTHDFWVNRQEDLVNANLKRSSEQDILDRLVMLGRLMGCARQLDVAMDSPQRVNHFVDLFLQGQYNFFGLSSPS